MDLLDAARREGIACYRTGLRRFGPVLERKEAEAIAVAALFELQDRDPIQGRDGLLRGVRSRVLSAMRDEARLRARARPLDDFDPMVNASALESRLDRAAREAWLQREVALLPIRDRDILLAEMHERGPRSCRGPRPASQPTRWRCLQRVIALLQGRATLAFGG